MGIIQKFSRLSVDTHRALAYTQICGSVIPQARFLLKNLTKYPYFLDCSVFLASTGAINGTDIYNDPNYLSALVHGRLVKKNTPEDEADEESEEEETTIGGNWLSVSGGTLKTENFLNRFDETNPAIVPIMNNN